MRRVYFLVVFLFLIFGAMASEEVRLRDLTRAMRELTSYRVTFEMAVNGERMDFVGGYIVVGDRYQLTMPGQVILGDSLVRYTIDDNNGEVVVERVDPSSVPMVISNPARAFTVLDQAFAASLKFTGSEYYTLWLRPKMGDPIVRVAELQISHKSHLPMSIAYTSHEGDRVEVTLDITQDSTLVIQPLDSTLYPSGYEVIDFR
ncbi:MAG: hypothetical protein SNH63_04705 [Rikenellaceae bacterium]